MSTYGKRPDGAPGGGRRRVLPPAEFHERLRRNDLRPSPAVTGIVKPSNQAETFDFSFGGCAEWVEMPLALIQGAEYVGERPCGEHGGHPVVQLSLRDSTPEDTPEFRLLAGVLAADFTFSDETTKEATTTEGNPCRDCVRRCFEVADDPVAFRDCVTRCPC
ncbi:hypothetical protein ACIO3S_08330 [Nocardioides sp. NPDC087217]|uniref:hypothetical protein n=1 Tax=Nocardioides sp. NPDC087217 TaxID=3364335 RepID=UPI0038125DD0